MEAGIDKWDLEDAMAKTCLDSRRSYGSEELNGEGSYAELSFLPSEQVRTGRGYGEDTMWPSSVSAISIDLDAKEHEMAEPREEHCVGDIQKASTAGVFSIAQTTLSVQVLDRSERLFEDYATTSTPKSFFRVGRVFLTVWSRPAGSSSIGTNSTPGVALKHFGDRVSHKVRRFIVIREGGTDRTVLPIETNGGRDVARSANEGPEHAIMNTGRVLAVPEDTDILSEDDRLNLRGLSLEKNNLRDHQCQIAHSRGHQDGGTSGRSWALSPYSHLIPSVVKTSVGETHRQPSITTQNGQSPDAFLTTREGLITHVFSFRRGKKQRNELQACSRRSKSEGQRGLIILIVLGSPSCLHIMSNYGESRGAFTSNGYTSSSVWRFFQEHMQATIHEPAWLARPDPLALLVASMGAGYLLVSYHQLNAQDRFQTRIVVTLCLASVALGLLFGHNILAIALAITPWVLYFSLMASDGFHMCLERWGNCRMNDLGDEEKQQMDEPDKKGEDDGDGAEEDSNNGDEGQDDVDEDDHS